MTKKYYTLAILVTVISITSAPLVNDSAFGQQSTVTNDAQSTIRVTGDASMKVEPDQAVITVVKQSQPADISTVLNDQRSSAESLIKDLKGVLGNDSNSSVSIGQMSVNPTYWGNPSYSDISTFTIYSTTSINTDIDSFSTIVKKLTESGYGFESVNAGLFMAPVMREAASGSPTSSPDTSSEDTTQDESNKITLNVTVNTKPGKLGDVLDEYDTKYAELTKLLTDAGVDTKDITPSNVNINPFYYGPNQSSIYQTYSQVIVKTSIQNIEKISDAALKSGAYVESTSLTVSDSAIEKIRDEVNKQALDNAKSRAEALARIAGLKIGEIKNIDAQNSIVNPYGGYQSYKGLYIIQPYYQFSGDIASSIVVEFELTQ